MASWLTAQLKNATELLEAVDKSVSRTVGTLGLAEGDPDYVPETAEYGGARPTGPPHQPGLPRAGSLASGTPAAATGSAVDSFNHAYRSPTSATASSTTSTGPSLPSRWDAPRPAHPVPAASAFPNAGSALSPEVYRAGTGGYRSGEGAAAGGGSTGGVGGGFTVKADAPIPFGAPSASSEPPGTRGGATAGLAGSETYRVGASVGLSPSYGLAQTAPAASASPYNDAAALGYVLSNAPLDARDLTAPSNGRLPPGGQAPGFVGAHGPGSSPRGPADPSSAAAAGPEVAAPEVAAPATAGPAAASGSAPAVAPSLAPAAPGPYPAAPQPAGSPPSGRVHADGPQDKPPHDSSRPQAVAVQAPLPSIPGATNGSGASAGAVQQQPAAPSEKPLPLPSSSAAATPAAAAAAAAGPAASSSAGTKGAATASPPSPAPLAAPTAAVAASAAPATPLSGGAASSLASAASAAATSLASTAVTHSLSLFNLVLDDPDGAPPAEPAPGGAAAASQQVQTLSRTCDQLRKRLEASRLENEQLEDMLARAEVRAQQEAALVAALREELAGVQQARSAAESSLAAQLAVARSGLAEVSDKYEVAQRTVLVLEGRLAALEESSRRLMEQHSDREGGMVDALRAELGSAESRLAAERKAHHATRAAAAAREQDLEQRVAGNTAALADLTRSLEEANRKSRALEEEVVEASRSRNDLADQLTALRRHMEAAGLDPDDTGAAGPDDTGEAAAGATTTRFPAGRPPRRGPAAVAAAAAAAELEVLRSELSQHQRAAQLARHAAEASQAQAARMEEELEGLRLALEQRKDTVQLEAQLREASDMLYLKQTQMERLAAEKAAQQLKTERELEGARQELAKLSRQLLQNGGAAATGRGADGGPSSSSSSSSHDVIPMDALGEPYQRLARNNKVGRAVKAAANFLDSTASTTAFVLRQYPLVRLVVFGYAVLLHLYVYLLIGRMQRLATHYEAVAAPVDG